jgi:hypothetical protein
MTEDVIPLRNFERRRYSMIKIFKMIVLLISLIFISPHVGFGGEPFPPNTYIGGPPIVGELTLKNQRDDKGEPTGYMTATFRGFCKTEYVKKKYCDFYLSVPFDEITRDILKNYVLNGEGPSDCNSECGLEDIVITKVIRFKKMGDLIIADIILRFLLPITQ